MKASLQPGSVISHYRVISALGVGGMGEVYLARDETLGRNVALKILPPEVLRNEERVRRFIREAQSASSLSHPHIVTIHEIGEAEVRVDTKGEAKTEARAGSGEEARGEAKDGRAPVAGGESVPAGGQTVPAGAGAASERVHYIAMEHIAGSTLTDLIHRHNTDLRTLLRYLAQAADGLAKAHAAGIIHRDLKPDNIMVTEDGYAKILDFGLAKLTEREGPAEGLTAAPTSTKEITRDGVVVGTAAYMSPEQVQTRSLDHRSDIFSFGSILYEAATRRRPFAADSVVETMHRILRDKPPAVEEINPDVPADVRRLIRRCLAKSPDQRLQSMKDLAIELNEIVEEYEALSISSGSQTSAVAGLSLASPRRTLLFRAGVTAAVIVGIAGAAFGLWSLRQRGGREGAPAPVESMKMTRLLSVENLVDAALSPDGKYLATVIMEAGRWSLRVRQVATGSDVQVLPAQETRIQSVRFTPDGNYLYYRAIDLENPFYSTLFQIPTLGGSPRKVIFDVDSSPAFSPDGRQIVFVRGSAQPAPNRALVIANADGRAERLLATKEFPNIFDLVAPSWSPDGRSVAAIAYSAREAMRPGLVQVAVSDGKESGLGEPSDLGIIDVAWLPDGSGLAVVAAGWSDPAAQIWIVPPAGGAKRITNDLNQYSGLSVSSDSRTIASAQSHRRANLWVVPERDPGSAKPIAQGPGEEGLDDVCAGPSGSVVFTAPGAHFVEIWSMDPGSGRRARLTPEGRPGFSPSVARETGLIAFTSIGDDGLLHVWRMDGDGGNLSQVTRGAGEIAVAVSPDGRSIVYMDLGRPGYWTMPLGGGPAVKIWDQLTRPMALPFTRDGKFLLVPGYKEVRGLSQMYLALIPAEGGPPIRTYDVPQGIFFRRAPSEDAITYVREVNGVDNIWIQPLGGGEPKPITTFTGGRIFSHDWSTDGSRIFLSRGEETTDIVLITGFR